MVWGLFDSYAVTASMLFIPNNLDGCHASLV